MKTWKFTVRTSYQADVKPVVVYATADRVEQATSNMLKAMLDDGHQVLAGWTTEEVSGS